MAAHLHIARVVRPAPQRRVRATGARDNGQLPALVLALLAAILMLVARTASGDVAVRVDVAPPPLPVYDQPPLPAPGYLWVPGYWRWGPEGYYWVPGTWVLPPDPDLVWTPGYWSFADDAYVWSPGYWAPQVGYYGGIDYGFGYFGHGYDGGYWRDRHFWYNRAVNNVGQANVTNVYNTTVNNVTVNNVSYNGGPGGIDARPTPEEQAAGRQPRHGATREQTAHIEAASQNHQLLASVNQGRPPIAATPQPNDYSGPGVMPARAGAHAGVVRGAPAHSSQNAPAQGPSARTTEQPPPQDHAPPRRLAEAPPAAPQSAPPATHEQPGPAERGTPPPQHAVPPAQTRAAPEIGPNERPQVGRAASGATPPPAPPRHEPEGRADEQPPH